MIKNVWALLLSVLLIAGCSNDPSSDYLGLWELNDSSSPKVMEITQEGETLLMNDNILQENDIFGNKKKPKIFNSEDGQLSIKTSFGAVLFQMSEDKNELLVANASYKKIDVERLNEIKKDIESQALNRKQNKARCHDLKAEYKNERELASQSFKNDIKAKNEKIKEIKVEYRAKQQSVPNCTFIYF